MKCLNLVTLVWWFEEQVQRISRKENTLGKVLSRKRKLTRISKQIHYTPV